MTSLGELFMVLAGLSVEYHACKFMYNETEWEWFPFCMLVLALDCFVLAAI